MTIKRQTEYFMKSIFLLMLLFILCSCAHLWRDSYGNPASKSDVFECDLKCGLFDDPYNQSVGIALCKRDCIESNVFDCDQKCDGTIIYDTSDSDMLVETLSHADLYSDCNIACMRSRGYK